MVPRPSSLVGTNYRGLGNDERFSAAVIPPNFITYIVFNFII